MFFVTLLVFIFVIGILVFVHELGHYVAARMVGIRVEEFAVGMGPKVWGYRKNGIDYNFRALPIGGFVKMYGESDYDLTDKDSFGGKAPGLRLIVLVAGVFMNLVLAMFIFAAQGVYLDYKYPSLDSIYTSDYEPWFGEKSDDKIAITEGLITDSSELNGEINNIEIIDQVNGEDYNSSEFIDFVHENKGEEVTFTLRGFYSNQTRDLVVIPRENPPEDEGPLGFSPITVTYVEYEGFSRVFAGVGQTFNTMQSFFIGIDFIFDQAREEKSVAPVAEGVGGAISIFQILELMISGFGLMGILLLMALFSVNLAIINILPIPALDGGHVLFTLLEIIFRRKLPAKIYNYLTLIGFVFLISLMILITFMDVIRHTSVGNFFCNDDRNIGFLCDLSSTRE